MGHQPALERLVPGSAIVAAIKFVILGATLALRPLPHRQVTQRGRQVGQRVQAAHGRLPVLQGEVRQVLHRLGAQVLRSRPYVSWLRTFAQDNASRMPSGANCIFHRSKAASQVQTPSFSQFACTLVIKPLKGVQLAYRILRQIA